jgi:Zn-dependent peptidase ImmA (M78 family)
MKVPRWYGLDYPTYQNLINYAKKLGANIGKTGFETAAFIRATHRSKATILMPEQTGNLKAVWDLAHEIGHLYQHATANKTKEKTKRKTGRPMGSRSAAAH